MDRRAKSRLDVRLVCTIADDSFEARAVRMLTENVSRTGILMSWTGPVPPPQVNKNIEISIKLPENAEFGPRVMRCSATVVRVSPGTQDEYAVALKIRRMTFVDPRDTTTSVSILAAMPAANRHLI